MKLYIKPYGRAVLSGTDFQNVSIAQMRRIVFSPNGIHSISVVQLRDGTLLITNERQVEFDFSISRNHRVVAVVRYRKNATSLIINNNWLITQEGVENRTVSENPDLIFSQNLNIDVTCGEELMRVDMKVHESGVACGVFTDRDLLFVRMNGNHVMPRISEFIKQSVEREISRLPPLSEAQVSEFLEQNPDVATVIGKRFFPNVVKEIRWFS